MTSGSQAIIALDERRRSYGFASPPFDGFALGSILLVDMSHIFRVSNCFRTVTWTVSHRFCLPRSHQL